MQELHAPTSLELYPSPRYMLRANTLYSLGLPARGLTKTELRQRVESWFKDEQATTLFVQVEEFVND